jgi:hypothetical protein
MIMKMPSGFYSTVKVPGNGVNKTLLNVYLAHRTFPALAFFGVGTGGLLNLKFNTAFRFGVRQSVSNHGKIKLAMLPFGSISARSATNHQYQLCSSE